MKHFFCIMSFSYLFFYQVTALALENFDRLNPQIGQVIELQILKKETSTPEQKVFTVTAIVGSLVTAEAQSSQLILQMRLTEREETYFSIVRDYGTEGLNPMISGLIDKTGAVSLDGQYPQSHSPPPDPHNCPPHTHWDPNLEECVADPQPAGPHPCPNREHWDDSMKMCMPDDLGKLNLRIHGNQFFIGDFQSGPRGDFKGTAPNMALVDLNFHANQNNTPMVSVMLTSDPRTVPNSGSPQVGQTGDLHNDGSPYVDHQHPHPYPWMGLTFSDILSFGKYGKRKLIIFFAPRGEATGGPLSFMHRPTAELNPFAPLSHHLQDAVFHTASTIVGINFPFKNTTLEASGFSGREAAPERVNLDVHKIDSYALRANHNINDHVSVGGSFASVFEQPPVGISPLASDPAARNQYVSGWMTTFNNINSGDLNTAFICGSIIHHNGEQNLNSCMAEWVYHLNKNKFYGRFEVLQRTPEQLLIKVTDGSTGAQWVKAFTAGYERTFVSRPSYNVYANAAYTHNMMPKNWQPEYGGNPSGVGFGVRIDFKHGWSWFVPKKGGQH